MLKMAREHKESAPEASKIIERDRYIDDLIHSCPSMNDNLRRIENRLWRKYLTRVVFRSEWHCCSKELQVTLNERSIPVQQQNPDFPTANNVLMIPERHDTNQINLDVEQVKTLRLSWNPTTDTKNFQVKLSDKEFFTKQIILSNISRLFDPLGLASVVTIKARIALQKIGKMKKFEWNDSLPKEMQLVWKSCLRKSKI